MNSNINSCRDYIIEPTQSIVFDLIIKLITDFAENARIYYFEKHKLGSAKICSTTEYNIIFSDSP